jgi:hypothetical protein
MASPIPNGQLTLADLPPADADWGAILPFAHSFDGYTAWGSFEACAEIANARRHDSLAELRTCLFFEARRWRHFGHDPDAEAMAYIRGVLEAIRARVTAAEPPPLPAAGGAPGMRPR